MSSNSNSIEHRLAPSKWVGSLLGAAFAAFLLLLYAPYDVWSNRLNALLIIILIEAGFILYIHDKCSSPVRNLTTTSIAWLIITYVTATTLLVMASGEIVEDRNWVVGSIFLGSLAYRSLVWRYFAYSDGRRYQLLGGIKVAATLIVLWLLAALIEPEGPIVDETDSSSSSTVVPAATKTATTQPQEPTTTATSPTITPTPTAIPTPELSNGYIDIDLTGVDEGQHYRLDGGWGGVAFYPSRAPGDTTGRQQLLRSDNRLVIFGIPTEGISYYILAVVVEDGVYDDSFDILVNDSDEPYLRYLARPEVDDVGEHLIPVPIEDIRNGEINVTFRNMSINAGGRSTVLSVRLRPVLETDEYRYIVDAADGINIPILSSNRWIGIRIDPDSDRTDDDGPTMGPLTCTLPNPYRPNDPFVRELLVRSAVPGKLLYAFEPSGNRLSDSVRWSRIGALAATSSGSQGEQLLMLMLNDCLDGYSDNKGHITVLVADILP